MKGLDNNCSVFYTYMRTERSAAASEHRTRNPVATIPMRFRYTNFVCTLRPV